MGDAPSVGAAASLSSPNETTASTHGSLTLAGTAIAYTATVGHLSALDANQSPEASIFYIAYTADGAAPATRPVTFFFNGGPGSASAWLHLGSFAPKRLATGVPATTQSVPFPYVDNTESLIDTSDLVFVDAVGTGLSEAIAPHTNQTYWGVDADAGVLRDFVQRWLAVNGRGASPLFLLWAPINLFFTCFSEEALFRGLVRARVKPYYLHHGDLAPGTAHLRATIEQGQELMRGLRGRVSGLCQPEYVLDIPGGHGKAPVGPSYLSHVNSRDRETDAETRYRIVDYCGDVHLYPPEF